MPNISGPDRSKNQPLKVASASKGLDESLENAPVVCRELTTILPPPAPTKATMNIQFHTQINNYLVVSNFLDLVIAGMDPETAVAQVQEGINTECRSYESGRIRCMDALANLPK